MISVHGIFENGKIKLLYTPPVKFPKQSNVVITFDIEEDEVEIGSELESVSVVSEEKDEEYYKSIREFERVKARGNITIIDDEEVRMTFPLNDYSQGGLSFISDKNYMVGQNINAGIIDPTNQETVLMELEMEVRGVYSDGEDRFKIGCMFLDPVDEDLWHGLLQYLS